MLSSRRHTATDYFAAQEYLHSRGWTDGLPVMPPTEAAVAAMLEYALLPADHLIGVESVRARAISAEKLAINAVMAGCLPSHFPIVVTAFTAMLQEPYLLHGATASTGGNAVLIIINGPVLQELGIDSTFNVLGASDRATAPIGRAIRLVLRNLMDVRPGQVDRSTLGHPGKISFCFGEDETNTSWTPLAQQRGVPEHASAVTVMAAGSPRQLMNEWTTQPEEILDTFVAEIKTNMRHYSIWPGNYAIVVPPQLRTHFESAGWSKSDIADYVFENARIYRRDWADCGKGAVVRHKGDQQYAALPDADHLMVVAAGGPAGGFGAVIPPWLGHKSRAVTMAVGACVDCE